jgi:hypothetical protein
MYLFIWKFWAIFFILQILVDQKVHSSVLSMNRHSLYHVIPCIMDTNL